MSGDRPFAGRVGFVTGAAKGFGAAFARDICAGGGAAAIADIDHDGAQALADELTAQGHRAIALACDVTDEAAVAGAVAQAADRLGGIDILINNAGLHSAAYNKGFRELGSVETRRLFDVNLFGILHCTLAARPVMAARGGGCIVNISSIASYGSVTAYGVSKLAVRGLTISLAHELAADGIRVNAIAPGLIATDTIRAELPQALFDDFSQRLQLIHRTGEVSDIVAAMRYLCSDAASFVTGETLRISGGYPLAI
ncbi:SDR family oxidoreductase [Sphingobium sp. Sx8-8]|uniref:SDR family NAD(P)-dependent oxidoreductase n=1 Tax=Sphingobium sp. Sx8-8 TaxID=2933617 RepID=UPI001F57CCEA|nr:SDR family oxidoreductase [Sphingobium sp. Sx8-8]